MNGLDNAGKTSILYKQLRGEVIHTAPTIGFNVKTLEFIDGYNLVQFAAWDLGGRVNHRPLQRQYYHGTKAIVFVVDSSDKRRIEEACDELNLLLQEDELRDAVLLVFANKQDLHTAMSVEEVERLLLLEKLRDRQWHIQGCSALTGQGVGEGFKWLKQALNEPGSIGGGRDQKPCESPANSKQEAVSAGQQIRAKGLEPIGDHLGSNAFDTASTASTADTDLAC